MKNKIAFFTVIFGLILCSNAVCKEKNKAKLLLLQVGLLLLRNLQELTMYQQLHQLI